MVIKQCGNLLVWLLSQFEEHLSDLLIIIIKKKKSPTCPVVFAVLFCTSTILATVVAWYIVLIERYCEDFYLVLIVVTWIWLCFSVTKTRFPMS